MTVRQKNLQKIKQGNWEILFFFSLETCTMPIYRSYETCSNETRSRVLLGGRNRGPMGLEVGIPLTYQFMDPVSGPLLEPLHYRGLDIFLRHKSTAL